MSDLRIIVQTILRVFHRQEHRNEVLKNECMQGKADTMSRDRIETSPVAVTEERE
jgi:hypothetical protein